METVLIGLSHKTAPVEIREKLCVPQGNVQEVLGRLAVLPGFREGLILSTCKRLEVLAVEEWGEEGKARVQDLLAKMGGMGEEELRPYLYNHKGEGAVRHPFRIASSL